jgi:hypothetical protein
MYEKITDEEIKRFGVANLSTTPTGKTPFGESGFTPAELRARFDKLPTYLAARFNEIIDGMADSSLANNIYVGVGSVGQILRGLFDGGMAMNIRIVTPTETLTLQAAVTRLVKLLDEIDNGEFLNGLQFADGKTLRAVILDLENKTEELNESLDSKVSYQTLDERIATIVGSAPETLNALNELAAALGNDPNFATTVANQIGSKAGRDELQETESAILEGLSAILAAQEEILGGSV